MELKLNRIALACITPLSLLAVVAVMPGFGCQKEEVAAPQTKMPAEPAKMPADSAKMPAESMKLPAEGASSGIHGPSVASCNNLFTIEQNNIVKVVGHLSAVLKQQLNDCLKVALKRHCNARCHCGGARTWQACLNLDDWEINIRQWRHWQYPATLRSRRRNRARWRQDAASRWATWYWAMSRSY